MYNLIEHSNNYSTTSEGLWQYYRGESHLNAVGDIVDFLNNDNYSDSFKFKRKVTGQTGDDGSKGVEIAVALKYLSNFWRTLEVPLINC